MALEIAAPSKGTGLAPRVGTRTAADTGPNLFLDNGWLQQSFDEKQDYQVTVDGSWVESEFKKGPNKGQKTEKLTGDAYLVVRQLRDAAAKLGIGVTIQYSIPTKKVKGIDTDIPGKVTIHYMGKPRKAARKAAPVANTTLTDQVHLGTIAAQQGIK